MSYREKPRDISKYTTYRKFSNNGVSYPPAISKARRFVVFNGAYFIVKRIDIETTTRIFELKYI